nr:cytochrome p450 71a1 [Quercus suber]
MFLHLGCVPTLVVSSPEMVKEMLKSHDIVFANRARTTALDIFLNGSTDLAFAPYGEYWKQVRRICVQELLSPDRVQSFQFLREEEVDIMIKKIQRSCLEGKQVNISEMLITVSNNIVFRTVIGQRNEGEDGITSRLKRTFKDIDALFELVIKEHKDKMLTTDGGQSDKKNFVEILLQLKEDGMLDFDLNQDGIKAILLVSNS